MTAKITTLIDKQDNNEKIRDQIAAIYAIEIANQIELAEAAEKNPDDFSFDVYLERSAPWTVGKLPLVNILFDNDRFDNKGSTVVDKQKVTGTFYIDCYATKDTDDTTSGDEAASKEVDRVARLARNIIMAGEYTYLCMGARESSNIVIKRSVIKREKFQPDIRTESYENIIACRLILEVEYEEYSPQVVAPDFELLINSCKRGEDGKVLFLTEKDMTEEE